MKVIFNDGNEFKGDNFKEIVNVLKSRDATKPNNINEYMKTTKERYSMIGVDVDTSNPKSFIKSLAKANI
ncbi:MAG: hypothetical protein ACOC22_02830, partial [bacterium]